MVPAITAVTVPFRFRTCTASPSTAATAIAAASRMIFCLVRVLAILRSDLMLGMT